MARVFRAVGRGIRSVGRAVGRAVGGAARFVGRGVRSIGRGIGRGARWLGRQAHGAWKGIGHFTNQVRQYLPKVGKIMLGGMAAIGISTIIPGAGALFGGILKTGLGAFGTAGKALVAGGKYVGGMIASGGKAALGGVANILKSAGTGVYKGVKGLFKLGTTLGKGIGKIGEFGGKILGSQAGRELLSTAVDMYQSNVQSGLAREQMNAERDMRREELEAQMRMAEMAQEGAAEEAEDERDFEREKMTREDLRLEREREERKENEQNKAPIYEELNRQASSLFNEDEKTPEDLLEEEEYRREMEKTRKASKKGKFA